jgi:hypothetical protein
MRAQRRWDNVSTFDSLKRHLKPVHIESLPKRQLNLLLRIKSSCTWTLSNHDQIRHATKMGLNPAVNRRDWMLSNGTSHPLDVEAKESLTRLPQRSTSWRCREAPT